MQVTRIQLSTQTMGIVFILFGLLLVWVRFAHERNRLARAIYWAYQKTQLSNIPLEPALMAGGIIAVGVGVLSLVGVVG
jgi:hypothetical protein